MAIARDIIQERSPCELEQNRHFGHGDDSFGGDGAQGGDSGGSSGVRKGIIMEMHFMKHFNKHSNEENNNIRKEYQRKDCK